MRGILLRFARMTNLLVSNTLFHFAFSIFTKYSITAI